MPNPQKTLIVGLIDRSASMGVIWNPTVEGWNAFVNSQKNVPGHCDVSLVLFDSPDMGNDWYSPIHTNTPIHLVPTWNGYPSPRGNTAYYAAMIRLIDETGVLLNATSERDRPGKVIFVTSTDGQENKSELVYPGMARHTIGRLLKDRINVQQSLYSWNFVYLGANQDAVQVGGDVGMAAGACATYNATPAGVAMAVQNTGGMVAAFRTGARSVCEYTPDEKHLIASTR